MWIQTYSGRKVHPLNMRLEDICLADIAHALSLTCRFTGHCKKFYSVAQHAVLVAQAVWFLDPDHDITNVRWGLFHDNGEAYIADIARPVKLALDEMGLNVFREAESRIMSLVCQKYKLPQEEPAIVKQADNLLLATEAKAFFGDTASYHDWTHRPQNGFPFMQPSIVEPWAPEVAERNFLAAAHELDLRDGL